MANYNDYLEYLKHIDNTTEQEIKSKINGLNDEISNLKTSLSNLNKVKDDLTTDLANAKKQINEKVDLINLKETELKKVSSDLVKVQKDLKETNFKLTELEKLHNIEQKKNASINIELSEIKLKYSTFENESNANLKNLQLKFTELEKKYNSEQEKNNTLNSEISTLKQTNGAIQLDLKHKMTVEKNYSDEIHRLYSDLKNKYIKLENELNNKTKSVNDYIAEIQKLHLDLENAKNDLKNISVSSTSANEQINKYRAEITDLNKTIDDLKKKNNSAELTDLKIKLDRTESELNIHTKNIQIIDYELKAEKEKNRGLNNLLVTKSEELKKENLKNKQPNYFAYITGFLAGLLLMIVISSNNYFIKKTEAEETIPELIESATEIDSTTVSIDRWQKSDFLLNLEKSFATKLNDEYFKGKMNNIANESYDFEGYHDRGLPTFGKAVFSDGSFYEGEFDSNGLRTGKGRKVWQNGEYYEGVFSENKFVEGKYVYEDGSYYVGHFENNQINGKGAMYDKNGILQYEGYFRNGQLAK